MGWLIGATIVAFINNHIAKKKNRIQSIWFFLGIMTGFLSTIVLLFLGKVEEPEEKWTKQNRY